MTYGVNGAIEEPSARLVGRTELRRQTPRSIGTFSSVGSKTDRKVQGDRSGEGGFGPED